MSTLINYFESPTKSINSVAASIEPEKTQEAIPTLEKKDSPQSNVKSGANKSINIKNQEIVKNMEEVLSLVKKKHRDKHKHDSSGKKSKHHKHHRSKSSTENHTDAKGSHKSPLKENRVSSNKKSKKNRKSATHTLPDLLSPTKKCLSFSGASNDVKETNLPEKVIAECEVVTVCDENQINPLSNSITTEAQKENGLEGKKKVNAFEFLMNARNKSIGGNSPGKEDIVNNDVVVGKISEVKKKRKLMLEEWADRRGAKKRKIDEVAREQFIEDQMEKRATRLKEMIEGGAKTSNKNVLKKIPKQKNKAKAAKEQPKLPEINASVEPQVNNKPDKKDEIIIRRSGRNSSKILNTTIESIPAEENNSLTEEQRDSFIEKLASPLKKRESLLGYFEKTTPSPTQIVNKPKESVKNKHKNSTQYAGDLLNNNNSTNVSIEVENIEIGSAKTQGRRKIAKKGPETPNSKIITENTPTSNGRPRRSCVGKTRYDLSDYDLSPEKNRKSRKPLASPNNVSEDVIVLDNTLSPISNRANTLPKKLAPLFVKAVPKPNIDPERVKARKSFLMSGIPEKMKIEMAKVKQFEQYYESDNHLFPKFNHIPPWSSGESDEFVLDVLLREEGNSQDIDYFSNKVCNVLAISDKPPALAQLTALKLLENKRILVKEWKNSYDKFPTYKCYNQLREKYRYFSAMDTGVDTLQVSESFVVSTRRNRSETIIDVDLHKDSTTLDNVKPPLSAPNGELLFSDKYKPLVSEQILVNITPVNQLKDFLSNWQNKNKCSRLDDPMDSSYEYNNDSNSASGLPNSVVIVGPTSSGKTNAVFALANELNFNVLEINAGMKRNGKKLLQDLHEATQSHQIRKEAKHSNKLLRKSLSSAKKNKKDSTHSNDNSPSSDFENNTKMSLILVEDADILFDNYDQGFVEAIYQLVGSSKRPVVVLANEKGCSHLQRLINQNCIEFNHPNGVNISKYLTILSLMENCPIHLDDVISLYYFNNMDLRKTILEIQFFIQSGGDRKFDDKKSDSTNKSPTKNYFASPKKAQPETENQLNGVKQDDDVEAEVVDKSVRRSCESNDFYIHKQLFEFFTVSQNNVYKIPYPLNFELLWINVNEIFNVSKVLNSNESNGIAEKRIASRVMSTSHLDYVAQFYENISLASNLHSYSNDCCLVNSNESEIAHYLVEQSVSSIMQIDELSYNLFDERQKPADSLSSYLSPANNQRSKKSIAVDFEPILRSICRSEKSKTNHKRANSRYYHYLRNISYNINSFSFQMFDDVCPIFVDDPKDLIELKNSESKSGSDWLD